MSAAAYLSWFLSNMHQAGSSCFAAANEFSFFYARSSLSEQFVGADFSSQAFTLRERT